MAATVSVSPPMATAARRADSRWAGPFPAPPFPAPSAVATIDRHAAWSAVTTKPLSRSSSTGTRSAASITSAQYAWRSRGRRGMPARGPSRVPLRTARSMAAHHSTHASPASGWGWVSDETARAAVASASSSPRWTSATGPVRMRLPLPAACGWARW